MLLPVLHPSLPTRVTIRTLRFIPSMTLHQPVHETLLLTSTNYISSYGSTSLKPNISIKSPLIPDDYRLQISKLAVKFSSRLNISALPDHPRNSQTSSSGRTKSLHDLAAIPSRSNSQTAFGPFTQFFTSLCWNQHILTRYRIEFKLHPHLSLSMTNLNSKSLKFSIRKSIIDVVPANYFILSGG